MIERQRPQLALTITSRIQQSILFMNKCFDSGFRFGIYDLLSIKPPERSSYCAAKPTKGDSTMKNVKKIAGSLLILGVMTGLDRKSTRLNSSHITISYAVFCLKKKKQKTINDV